MSGDSQPDSLVGVFMAEAVEDLERLRSALQPADGSLPLPDSVQSEYIVAHRLRGAASLYGFAGVAGLAELMEAALEGAAACPPADWPGLVTVLRDLLEALRAQIDRISRLGTEDRVACEAWKTRHAHRIPASATPKPESSEAPASNEPPADAYLLPELDAEVFSYFSPEAQEYVEAIEASLLKLDKDPHNPETIQVLFRTAHTLKGSAYTVGFTAIGDLVHYVEDLMGAIREGGMSVTPGMADAIFKSVDVVRLLLKRDSRLMAQVRGEFVSVKQRLQRMMEPTAEAEPAAVAAPAPKAIVQALPAEPVPQAEPQPQEAPAGETGKAAPKEVEEGAVIRVSRERLERLLNLVGELVIGRGRLEQRLVVLEQLSSQVLVYKSRLSESVRSFEEKHAFTLPMPAPETGERGATGFNALSDFGALEFDKYDDFNILARRVAEISADVGESMSQLSGSIRKAREDMGHLQRLTLGMRDEIARARMVPIGTPFTRFRRAVREMARATGKEVNLITSGEQTEVDTVLVERLVDPLVHLVRNAVYHGIETTAVRLARGKPATGTVYLHAAHRGNAAVVEVEDDGGGIDVEKIKAKAIAMGVVRPELAAGMSESEAMKLIFLPGFSTADAVGEQAGRGVGMDVVKRTIEAINGHIEIETEKGVGTKFTLSLPLTLLISTALLVRVGTDRYAIPLASIREVVLPARGAVQEISGRSILQAGEEAIDVRSFARLLGQDQPQADGPLPIVIVRTATGAIGLTVDELLGRQEIVIKTLGTLKPFRESCFVGATIDPEGRVVLVVDVSRLVGGRPADALPTSAAAPASLTEEGAEEEVLQQSFGPPASGILLIDDSLSVRKFVGRMLEGGGYEVDTAVDGEDGLRKASLRSYQLIITDLEMPKLNGYEVIQALRVRQQTKHTPILVMTTRAGEKHRQMALSMGATGYITKPVEEKALVLEVEQRIGATGAMA